MKFCVSVKSVVNSGSSPPYLYHVVLVLLHCSSVNGKRDITFVKCAPHYRIASVNLFVRHKYAICSLDKLPSKLGRAGQSPSAQKACLTEGHYKNAGSVIHLRLSINISNHLKWACPDEIILKARISWARSHRFEEFDSCSFNLLVLCFSCRVKIVPSPFHK